MFIRMAACTSTSPRAENAQRAGETLTWINTEVDVGQYGRRAGRVGFLE